MLSIASKLMLGWKWVSLQKAISGTSVYNILTALKIKKKALKELYLHI